MELLNILYKSHKTWIKYLISFGCNQDTAEDYVQEMYIKIYEYSLKRDNDLMYNKDEVNYFFVYVTLRNLYYDNLRKNKKIIKVDETFIPQVEDEDYTEDLHEFHYGVVKQWYDELNEQIILLEDYKLQSHLCYIKFVYEKIFIQHTSVSELSRSSGITYWSLRNTVLQIKNQIKEL
jgi:hypothetical protein